MNRCVRNLVSAVTFSALALLGSAGSALAATATSNLAVSATVTNNCTISAGALAFGSYGLTNVNGAPLDATATITLQCTNGDVTDVTLGQGINPTVASSDAVPVRQMLANTADLLLYTLAQASDHTLPWGNTPTSGNTTTGTGATTTLTVYGRILRLAEREGRQLRRHRHRDDHVLTCATLVRF